MLNRELKAENSLLNQLVDSTRVGMFAKDEHNKFVYANRAFCEHLQVPREKILHKKHIKLSKSTRKYTIDDKTVLKTRNIVFNLVENKDTDSWIETVKFPWIDHMNQLRGIYGFSYDVSDNIRAEEGLRETKIDLKKAELINDALRQFSYAASHDLQEPLRSVQGFLNLLRIENESQLGPKADLYIAKADESLQRMQQLIKDILDYAVINGAKYELQPVDLNQVVGDVLQSLNQSIKEHHAHIYIDELPIISGNAGLMNHYFQNMLSNALKYRSPGVDPEIHVFNHSQKGKFVIGIKDNGIGIDPLYYEEIFKPFKRLHRKSEYKGSGIGLATSKKIVKIHAGKLWVESKPGDGSTFYLELPKK